MATPGADPGGAPDAAEAAERAYIAMDEPHRLVARGLLLRLVPLDGSGDTGRRLPLIDLQDPDRADALAHVLNALEQAGVVTVDGQGITLADQSLAETWPRLRIWIGQDTSVLATAHRTIDAAHVWVRERFPATRLLRGPGLTAALATLPAGAGDLLGPTARMFVQKSVERRHWWKRKLLRRRLALIGVLVLIAGTITAVSLVHRSDVEKNAALRSRRLVAAAKQAVAGDPDLAVRFAVAAYRASPSPQATQLMYDMLNLPAGRAVGEVGNEILRVAAQGPVAVVVSASGLIRIWSPAGPGPPRPRATFRAKPSAIALTPDGRVLAGPCVTHGLCLWNLADPGHPAVSARLPLPAHLPKTGFFRMAVSPDGTRLAAATLSGHTLLWSIARPAKPRLLHEFVTRAGGPLNGHLSSVAFAPNGRLLAITLQETGSAKAAGPGEAGLAGHGATELWNVADAAHPSAVAKLAGGYQAVAFNSGGNLLAAAGDTRVALWRLDRNGHPAAINARPSCAGNPSGNVLDIHSIAFAPDGDRLSYTGTDASSSNPYATICTLSVSSANLYSGSLPATSVPTPYGIDDLTYTPGGTLFTGGNDGVARLWRTPVPQIGGLRTDDTTAWDVSQDGRLLAAPIAAPGPSAKPKSFGVWDISSPDAPVLDTVVPGSTEMISFLGARTLQTVAYDGAVRLWNLADPRHPAPAAALGSTNPTAPGGVTAFVTSDTAGDLVSVLDAHGRLHLWKITRGPGAHEVGSLPATGPFGGAAGVLPDGRTALTLTAAGLTWWDIADPAHPRRGGTSRLTGGLGVLDAGGSLVAAANWAGGKSSGAALKLYHLDSGRTASEVTVTTGAVSQLRFSPDTHLLAATVGSDNVLVLWDVTDPRHPRRRGRFAVPGGADIAFSRTDHRMADWSNQTVQLWDIRDPAKPVAHASLALPAQTADEPVTGALFSTNGRTLYVATGDSVFLYDADPAALADRLCSAGGRAVTRAQWRRYAPGVPYENPCPK